MDMLWLGGSSQRDYTALLERRAEYITDFERHMLSIYSRLDGPQKTLAVNSIVKALMEFLLLSRQLSYKTTTELRQMKDAMELSLLVKVPEYVHIKTLWNEAMDKVISDRPF